MWKRPQADPDVAVATLLCRGFNRPSSRLARRHYAELRAKGYAGRASDEDLWAWHAYDYGCAPGPNWGDAQPCH